METKTVGILGAGTMGHGIAQVLIRSGYTVFLHDLSQQFLDSGTARIAKGLKRDVEKNRLTDEERERALSRLKPTTRVADLGGAEFIVEAVTENLEVKEGAFREIERLGCETRSISWKSKLWVYWAPEPWAMGSPRC